MFAAIAFVLALSQQWGSPFGSALADSRPSVSLSELDERARLIEERHDRELRRIESGVSSGSIDPDAASEARFRADQTYRRDVQAIQQFRDETYRALDQKDRKSSSVSRQSSPSRGAPKIPSQSVLSFPGRPTEIPQDSAPPKEGEGENVGFGVRELKF